MKEILNVIHNTIYQFIDVCNDAEEVPMSDKDKLLLEVNKAICNNLNALEQQPCEDCISREATIDAIYKKYIGGKDAIKNAPINDLYAEGLAEAVDAVWDMPSITPTRPTGKWIEKTGEGFDAWAECSKCGCVNPFEDDFNYCPNCGARMTKVESEEEA